ncbi:MAG: hypothetical protein IPP74_12510 [Alphaproteobacteria bacterium]|nr:hypothetical protein [Alphaproteobacteria bacterium]
MENYQEAKQRYFARLENIKHLLERLSQASSENFGVAPEKVARRDMVFVHEVEEKLIDISDRILAMKRKLT